MNRTNKEILKRYRDMKCKGLTTNWIVEKRAYTKGYLEALGIENGCKAKEEVNGGKKSQK